MSHLEKCHNCLESLTTQMLSVHLKLKTCTLKCKVCWTDLTPPNLKDAWMADVTNSDFVRIHQESLDCKEQSANNFFCDRCLEKFDDEEAFIMHNRQKCKIQCRHCGAIFCRRFTRNVHAKNCIGQVITCNHCLTGFVGGEKKQQYQQHIQNCETVLQCNHCTKLFKGPNAVEDYETHYEQGLHRKKCRYCDKEVTSLFLNYEMKVHNLNHVGEIHKDNLKDEVLQECVSCGEDFERFRSKTKYEALKHHVQVGCIKGANTEKTVECYLCHKEFTGSYKIRDLTRHFNKSCTPLKCPKCSKEFTDKNKVRAFENHIKQEPGCKDLNCENCGHKFVGKKAKQQKKYHTKYDCGSTSGPAVCQYCHKEFTNFKKYLKLSQHIKKCTKKT